MVMTVGEMLQTCPGAGKKIHLLYLVLPVETHRKHAALPLAQTL